MASRGIWRYMSARRQRSMSLLWAAIFTASLLLQYASLVAPRSTIAASGLLASTVQGFEIDGDLKSGNGASNPGAIPPLLHTALANGDDWRDGSSASGVVDPATAPSSFLYRDAVDVASVSGDVAPDDSAYGGGNKEDDTRDWVYVNSAGPNPKTDFRHVMAYAKYVGNSAFLYLGAERLNNEGTLVVDFELNRKTFKEFSVGPAKPNRTDGDLLISLEYSNGGSNPIVTLYKIDNVVDFATGQTNDFVKVSDATVSAAVRSATNFETLTSAGFGYDIEPFLFAEASFDLAALGINAGCPGFTAGHIRSRTGGDPQSSQLKDAAPNFPIDLNNCGKLRIEKEDEDGQKLGGATFTISPDPRPGQTGTLTVVDGGANDPDGAANGVIEFDPAKPDGYTVTETKAPAGYLLDGDPQTKTVAPNGSATFTFVNKLGTVAWKKYGPDGTTVLGGATFVVTPNPKTGTGSLTVVDNGANDADGTAGEFTVSNARLGTYQVCETVAPAGYILDTDCAEVSVTAADLSGSIAAGMFVNTLGTIAWQKNGPDGSSLLGGATFSITPNPATGDGSISITDQGVGDADAALGKFKIDPARVGTYAVCETGAPSGYLLDPKCENVSVSAASPNGALAVGTFINRLGSISWTKTDEEGNLLAGATFKVTIDPSDGEGFMTVVDNGANDADPIAGKFKVINVPRESYEVCETVAPTGYVKAAACKTAIVDENTPDAELGAFVNSRGSIRWTKVDEDGGLLGGATFTVDPDPSDGVALMTVVDNGPNDDDKTNGEFEVVDVPLGAYSICETVAPTGYILDATCRPATLTQEAPSVDLGAFVNKLGSIAWTKVDEDGALLGGATFTVDLDPTDGVGKLTVVDNDANDADKTNGEFEVVDVPLGTYSICETVAPTGYILDGACKQAILTAQDAHVTLAPFVNELGSISWTKVDEDGTLLGGATFTVDLDPTDGVGKLTVVDNDANDADKTNGEFKVVDVPLGTYSICETVAPTGYILDGACKQAVLTAQNAHVTLAPFVNTLGSLSWVKTKGDEAGTTRLGGATFSISPNPYGSGTLTIVDNDANDADPDAGEFSLDGVKLGSYTITETAAPEGYVLDPTPCQVVVSAADPTGDKVCSFENPPVAPTIKVVKTAGETAGTQVADGLTYSTEAFANNTVYKYVVTNTGAVRLLLVTLTDDNGTPANVADDFLVCPVVAELEPAASFTCTSTKSIAQDTTNIASVVGYSVGESTPATDTDDAKVVIVGPAITIIKTAGGSLAVQVADGGTYPTEAFAGNVTYVYLVKNTGDVPLNGITVKDDNGTPDGADDFFVTCPKTSLVADESMTCSAVRTVGSDRTNVATVTGFTTQQPNVPVSHTDDAVVEIIAPDITIIKTAGDASNGGVYTTEAFPSNVTYTYVVTNTGDTALSGITVKDDNGTAATGDDFTVTCPKAALAIDESMTCSAVRTVNTHRTNIAVATGTSPAEDEVTDDDDAIVNVVTPSIKIVKTAGTAADGASFTTLAGPVTYTYVVTNTGETALSGVIVTDDNGTPGTPGDDFSATCPKSTLAIGESMTCTKTVSVSTNRTNIGTADGTSPSQAPVTDTDDAIVVIRTPLLTIDKSFTGNTGSTDAVLDLPKAKIGDTLTYTLAYTLTNGPVTGGVITDVLPVGLEYVVGSATNNAEFTFISYTSATRTLRWTAATVTASGSVTYQVLVPAAAAQQPQPLVNVATVDSNETPPDSDDAKVVVAPPPAQATATPRITLPPTSTLDGDRDQSDPGFGMLLALLALAGLALTMAFVTPMPARARRRGRRG
jgi:uncharacterized repeat protein (TIGR01451 family)